jgi:hypothetical protein
MADPDFLYDRKTAQRFVTALARLRDDTEAVVESGPVVIELVGGYFLFIDPGNCASGFTASIFFSPPHTDNFDAPIAERQFEGGKADLFSFVIDALCDDLPNLPARLACWDD